MRFRGRPDARDAPRSARIAHGMHGRHAAQGAAPYAARSRIGIRERRTAGERRPDERMEIAQRGAYRSPAHSA
ncbi:hypothetical protein SZ29_18255 [Burkholderia pseudomallei]|nr:hypothetical protein SZ29_18255 [Burkholderia pseudomallei]